MGLNQFNKRAAKRISAVSLIVALIVTPSAWLISREKAETRLIELAMEESQRLLAHYDALSAPGSEEAMARARQVVGTIAGGLFDIAEIFDSQGNRLAIAATDTAAQLASTFPPRRKVAYTEPFYESLHLHHDHWALRIYVPLYQAASNSGSEYASPFGYFEGVRIIPDWQRRDIASAALSTALIACAAALFCGVAVYPLVVALSMENQQQTRQILDSHISMMETLGRAIALRDSDTGNHNYRVAWIAARIGEELQLARPQMQSLIAGSFLHDAGKIGIPDQILRKQGVLSEDERRIMRTHVHLGESIVMGLGWLEGAHEIVAYHHERWDGAGYPRQLAGSEIPLSARIFAVADVFDALSSKRPYKEAFQFEVVIDMLKQERGRHFDPQVLDVFLGISSEIRRNLTSNVEEGIKPLLHNSIRTHFELVT